MSRLKAAQAANKALNELRIDQANPIDPFQAIEDVGLELRFRRLTGLLGAILPGETGGVLINSDRPVSLQRYTAAHELGHWYMDQDVLSLDTEALILGGGHQEERETNAQIFAAHFLMPLELIHSVAHRYGIRRETTTSAEQAYQAARDMRVSYEAATRQLRNLGLISAANYTQLLRTRPAVIKSGLAEGTALPDARGEVWIVEQPKDRVEIRASVGDTILVRLTENPSTGYRWFAKEVLADAPVRSVRPAPEPFNGGQAFADSAASSTTDNDRHREGNAVSSDVVSLIRDEVVPHTYEPGVTFVGGEVTRLVAYAANAPGEESIQLDRVRPARPDVPAHTLKVTTFVRGVPEVEFRRRLLEAFKRDEEDWLR